MSDMDTQDDAPTTEVAEGTQDHSGEEQKPEKDWQAEADKWKALARKHESTAKANADAARKYAEVEESQKTEAQRSAERIETAERRAAEAEAAVLRYEVAADRQLPSNLMRFLNGATREELEEQADALLAAVKPDTGDDDNDGSRRRPKERLRPGAVPGVEPERADPKDAHQQLVAGLLGGGQS
jgi:hypothetical protein